MGTDKPRLLPVIVFPHMDTSQPQILSYTVEDKETSPLAFNQGISGSESRRRYHFRSEGRHAMT